MVWTDGAHSVHYDAARFDAVHFDDEHSDAVQFAHFGSYSAAFSVAQH